MSRLIEKLNRVTQAASQPIGFMAARSALSESRILLIASLSQITDAGQSADFIEGADAVVLRPGKSHITVKTFQNTTKELPDIPWGIWQENNNNKKTNTLIEAGGDFLVLPSNSRVAALPQDEKIGRILQVEASLSNDLLRAVNDLPIDAVLATDTCETNDSMKWDNLINIQRLVNLLNKPLIVAISLNDAASELRALWEAGVSGVVVDVDTGVSGRLKELRQIISELPPPSSRKRGKAEALLPYSGGVKEREPEEEEEEEYE